MEREAIRAELNQMFFELIVEKERLKETIKKAEEDIKCIEDREEEVIWMYGLLLEGSTGTRGYGFPGRRSTAFGSGTDG